MNTNAELYTQDLYAWTQEQAARLREGAWHELDLEHLIVSRRVRPRSRSTSAEARGLHGGFLRKKHELSGRVCRQVPTTAFVGDKWGRSKKVSEGLTMSTNAALYDQDFYTWCLTTAALIRAGKWYDLDPASVAEEIESLGKSDRRALGSHLKNLVLHLLKWHYQPAGRQPGHSWRQSIRNARAESAVLLEDSPSLRQAVPPLLVRWYPLARQDAADETGLPLATFPEVCPWTAAQVLEADFWPEGEATP